MATAELVARWSRIERLLRDALSAHRSELTSEQADLVSEYLDHNELGLAVDLLKDTVAQPNEPLTQAVELMA